MKDSKRLAELRRLFEQRGDITEAQMDYARTEIRAIKEIYSIKRPSRDNCMIIKRFVSKRGLSINNN
jgi:hypothetical protein